MKDLSKLQSGMNRLFDDDKKIRDALKKYDLLFGKNHEVILNEAGGRMVTHKMKVLNILKRLYAEYRLEIDAAINIIYDITARQDRALTLARKLTGKGAA
ncbi:MAG: hypothetical protein JXA07_12735 [Spirochaetes bacterium]|nr:hypothetical protein [Spirochaetota bacterium]